MSVHPPGDRTPPPAREDDLAAAEAQLDMHLPQWWRERLAAANGGFVDDRRGQTRTRWDILPVLDRRDRKSMMRTAESIVQVTHRFEDADSGGRRGVVVARAAGTGMVLMIVSSDGADGDSGAADLILGEARLVCTRAGSRETTPVDPLRLGTPESPRDAGEVRPRSELPTFRYHPDPVTTGSIADLPGAVCPVCDRSTGWAYVTTPYAIGTHEDICPWCIADGSAARRFGARFIDVFWFDDDPPAPLDRLDELAMRTPGFVSWQQEVWQYCCDDACAFLGVASADTLSALSRGDRDEIGIDEAYIDDLRGIEAAGREPCDAVPFDFRCLHCGRHHVWIDVS